MEGYLQLDRNILSSTVWVGTDSDTKVLWLFLLLSADIRTGKVSHTIPAIVRDTEIPREKIEALLRKLSSPDPDSRSPNDDGRRISFVDPNNINGGILILNYVKYREKHYNQSAERMRRKRYFNANVAPCDACDAHVTKEKEKEKEKEKNLKKEIVKEKSSSGLDQPVHLSEEIQALEGRYPKGLPGEIREACALSRKNGKMGDAVWLGVLLRLAKYPLEVVERSGRLYLSRYADGSRDESYLLGIVRGESKKRIEDNYSQTEMYTNNSRVSRLDGAI